jgi:hypothetical protein
LRSLVSALLFGETPLLSIKAKKSRELPNHDDPPAMKVSHPCYSAIAFFVSHPKEKEIFDGLFNDSPSVLLANRPAGCTPRRLYLANANKLIEKTFNLA